MARSSSLLGFACLVFAASLAACSSSNGGSNGSGGKGSSTGSNGLSSSATGCGTTSGAGFPGFGVSKDACGQCETMQCASELAGAFGAAWSQGDLGGGACGPYFKCAEPCCGNVMCIEACGLPPSACQSAIDAIKACEVSSCAAACGGSSSSSSTSSSSTSSSTSSGGQGGTACNLPVNSACQIFKGPAADIPTFEAQCMAEQGQSGASCPTAGLVGCCTVGTLETCEYQGLGLSAQQLQMICTQQSGAWSTTQ